MRSTVATALSLLCLAVHETFAGLPNQNLAQGIKLARLRALNAATLKGITVQQANEFSSDRLPFETLEYEQPLDHFSKDNNRTFKQRYWVNDRHYKSGGPVIVIDSGETSGVDRLPFLDKGIAEIVARETNGLGIVLEHRYYGTSFPHTNFSTDELRFLNNSQSAADSARFMANFAYEDIDEDLRARSTPWIYYGGSYAGARSAHMRVLYPDHVFGAIASSAVTHATLSNWEYSDIIRNAAPEDCSAHLVNAIKAIDFALTHPPLRRPIKSLFGLADLEHDEDFVSLISQPLGAWQARNWDPEVGSDAFFQFCDALGYRSADGSDELTLLEDFKIDFTVVNYAAYIKERYVSLCPEDRTIEECFGTWNDEDFQDIHDFSNFRAWVFQVCTEWGYFFTAPPEGHPRIVSKLLTLDYASRICQQAYPAGEHFRVPAWPNISAVNGLGDFGLAMDRLAFIDGEVDPWRPDTPHSEYARERKDTTLRPFKLIPGGVHHWDENGLENWRDEPPEIQLIHAEIVEFVQEWLKDWKKTIN